MKKESLIPQNEKKCQSGNSLFMVNYLAFTGCSETFEIK